MKTIKYQKMKNKSLLLILAAFCFAIVFNQSPAQAQEPAKKKKVVIDKDGNKHVEKIVKEGDEVIEHSKSGDADHDIQIFHHGKEIDVDVEKTDDGYIIIRKTVDGETTEHKIKMDEHHNMIFGGEGHEPIMLRHAEMMEWHEAGEDGDIHILHGGDDVDVEVEQTDDGYMIIRKTVDGKTTEKRIKMDEHHQMMKEKKMMFFHGDDHDGEFHINHEGQDVEVEVEKTDDGYMIIRKTIDGETTEQKIKVGEGENYFFGGEGGEAHGIIVKDINGFDWNEGIACDRPFLGVVIENYGEGLLVKDVFETSGAEAAGIQLGDIITTIDGEQLSSIPVLSKRLGELEDGSKVSLVILRDGETINTTATLQDREKLDAWEGKYKKYWIAIKDRVSEEETREKAFMGVLLEESEDRGVSITGTVEESGARSAGITGGDALVSIEGDEIGSIADISEALSQFEPGETISVGVIREGVSQNISLTLGGKAMERINWRGCDESLTEEEVHQKVIIIKCVEEVDEESPVEIEETPIEVEEIREPEPQFVSNELQLEGFLVYPNPAKHYVNVRFDAEAEPVIVSVVDASGKQVYDEFVHNFNGSFSEQIDLYDAAPGTAIITIRQGSKMFTEKIIRN